MISGKNLKRIQRAFLGIIFLFFLFIKFMPDFCFAQHTEPNTLSTYYPAPFGVYSSIRILPTATVPACDEGAMYYDSATKQLRLCQEVSGVLNWHNIGAGAWMLSGNMLYPNNTNWNVGIGTVNPFAPLTIIRSGTDPVVMMGSGAANETATFGWSTANFAYIQGGTWGSPTARALVLQGGSANTYSNSLGAGTGVGIGTQPASGYALDVNGKLKAKNIYLYRFPNIYSPGSSGGVTVWFPPGQFNTTPFITCSITSAPGAGSPTSCGISRASQNSCDLLFGTHDPQKHSDWIHADVIAMEQ